MIEFHSVLGWGSSSDRFCVHLILNEALLFLVLFIVNTPKASDIRVVLCSSFKPELFAR